MCTDLVNYLSKQSNVEEVKADGEDVSQKEQKEQQEIGKQPVGQTTSSETRNKIKVEKIELEKKGTQRPIDKKLLQVCLVLIYCSSYLNMLMYSNVTLFFFCFFLLRAGFQVL